MAVKLISLTGGVGDHLSTFGPEGLIGYIARVSNPDNQMNKATMPKLLGYLIKNKHWSPFEHVSMTVEITTSRGIAAQILRHRSFVFQEFSQRYAQAFEYVEYEARRQDDKNRQNSIDDMGDEDKKWFKDKQKRIWKKAKADYDEAIKRGIAKEQARFLLPLNTETKLYMTGSVRSWIHYVDLRSGNGTQKEHMDIANAVKNIMKREFPSTTKAMGW
jgi:thymidylate synthase (FAD)